MQHLICILSSPVLHIKWSLWRCSKKKAGVNPEKTNPRAGNGYVRVSVTFEQIEGRFLHPALTKWTCHSYTAIGKRDLSACLRSKRAAIVQHIASSGSKASAAFHLLWH